MAKFFLYLTLCLPLFSSYADVISICRTGLNKPVLDHQTTLDTIVISLPPDSRILDVNIKIDTLFHEYDSDLRFYLRHLGAGVRFISNVGGGGNNFISTNINDSASCYIGQVGLCNTAPFSGTYRPTSPATLLPFNYQPAGGLWILAVTDTFPQDEGVLKSWCVTITYDNLLSVQNNNQPVGFSLYQNYPNPFNPSTTIRYDIPPLDGGGVMFVRLTVFDLLGREITTLVNEELKPGSYEIAWDASAMPSGIYCYRIESPLYTDTKKMTLIR